MLTICACSKGDNETLDTENAYYEAINIEYNELDISEKNSYSYDGLSILPSDIEWLSSDDKLSQGSLYRSVAKSIENYIISGNMPEERCLSTILGNHNNLSEKELNDHVNKISMLVSTNRPLGEVLSQVKQTSVATGKFDFNNGIFDFEIIELSKASKELGLTEELFGYTLAWLKEYGAEVRFTEDGSCVVKMKYFGQREINKDDFTPFVDYVEETNILDELPEGSYHFYINGTPDELIGSDADFKNFSTSKGIQLLSTEDAVILHYGKSAKKSVDFENDIAMTTIPIDNPEHKELLKECKSYRAYNYGNKGQIIFYFNNEGKVHMVLYTNVVIY